VRLRSILDDEQLKRTDIDTELRTRLAAVGKQTFLEFWMASIAARIFSGGSTFFSASSSMTAAVSFS
jgi:hypothetical protein